MLEILPGRAEKMKKTCRKAGFSLSKNFGRTENEIGRDGVYVAPAAIFLAENPIFQKKNRFLADFTAGSRRLQVKSGRGGCGGGACSPGH